MPEFYDKLHLTIYSNDERCHLHQLRYNFLCITWLDALLGFQLDYKILYLVDLQKIILLNHTSLSVGLTELYSLPIR